jgi:sugar lactone lactonase YvrE
MDHSGMKTAKPVSRASRMMCWSAVIAVQLAGYAAYGQVSPTAYRVLGQSDLRRNGVNGVQGVELNNPLGIALDQRSGRTRLYIADSSNSRVLAWPDVGAYQMGDPPALILAQRGPEYSIPLGIGAKGLNAPIGMAVDPTNGDLYVADTGNNRVVRFLAPFENPGRIEPDAVYGQASFNTRTAGAPTNSSLNQPRGLAFDSAGNLWVADTGNHRVLRFAAVSLNNTAPVAADKVVGQRDFVSGAVNSGANTSASGFDTPIGLAFDPQGNLYVSDFRNARVLRFAASPESGAAAAATALWGQANFSARGAPAQASGSFIAGPQGIAVDSNGNLYVSDVGYNRVLAFPLSGGLGAPARIVLGQPDFTTSSVNTGSAPYS